MEKIEKILMNAESEGRYNLYESEVYGVLKEIGMPTPKHSLIYQASEIRKARKNYGNKVVMKISSPDIMHKINVGGVKIVDNNLRALKNAYERMLLNVKNKAPHARITGVLLTEYINIDHEMLVSMLYDDQFEHFITVGMGGLTTEIYKDISIRLPPVSEKDAREMLQELKIYPILQGYRGKKGANQEKLISTIRTLNTLAKDFSPCSNSQYIIKELEINPMACSGEKIIPVDGLLRFERKKAFKPRSRIKIEGIKNFFTPKSVAVIGATDDKRPDGSFKEGKIVMDNMLKSKIPNIYPVNPKKEQVLNKKCYKSIKEIPDDVDLAIVLIPAKATPKVMEEIKEK
ncbi:MAG: acetate--CoA ligase family protein, partial [Nanoarchaeota archaeon]|nr:acetate--CoA ligase family protein [Nanoarchaeota archaeon]